MKILRYKFIFTVTISLLAVSASYSQITNTQYQAKISANRIFSQGVIVAKSIHTDVPSQQVFAAGFLGGFLRGLVYADFPIEKAVFDNGATIHDSGWTAGFNACTRGTSAELKDIHLTDLVYTFLRTNGIVHLESYSGEFTPSNSSEHWNLFGNRDFYARTLGDNDSIHCDYRVDIAGYKSPSVSNSRKSFEFVVKEVFSIEK